MEESWQFGGVRISLNLSFSQNEKRELKESSRTFQFIVLPDWFFMDILMFVYAPQLMEFGRERKKHLAPSFQ